MENTLSFILNFITGLSISIILIKIMLDSLKEDDSIFTSTTFGAIIGIILFNIYKLNILKASGLDVLIGIIIGAPIAFLIFKKQIKKYLTDK